MSRQNLQEQGAHSGREFPDVSVELACHRESRSPALRSSESRSIRPTCRARLCPKWSRNSSPTGGVRVVQRCIFTTWEKPTEVGDSAKRGKARNSLRAKDDFKSLPLPACGDIPYTIGFSSRTVRL